MAFELALVASRRAHRNIHSCSRSALLCSPVKRDLLRLGLPQNKQRASTIPHAISGREILTISSQWSYRAEHGYSSLSNTSGLVSKLSAAYQRLGRAVDYLEVATEYSSNHFAATTSILEYTNLSVR
jgi:hypothetical protein